MDPESDSFQQNIDGVRDLIGDGSNKSRVDGEGSDGVVGEYEDVLELNMSDEELLELKDQWTGLWEGYEGKIKNRQVTNKTYYAGKQLTDSGQTEKTVGSNLIFESQETFIPQALSKNPEPVVFSDNSDEGKVASNDIKTMLQYHGNTLCLRRKLGVMTRHWSIYFVGVLKHGWDPEVNDISTEVRKPKNFVLDPDGYVDEFANFRGKFLGEKIESTAEELIRLFPKKKAYILIKVNGKLGTSVVRTEWWSDRYCFTTWMDIVLDKHKNEFFNYDVVEDGIDEYGLPTKTVTPGKNHFAVPKMPYTFLSVFSLQETPHDTTNLIEQNIANQDRIVSRDQQVDKNLGHGNNAIAVSGDSFDKESAAEAADALEKGDPVFVPEGDVQKAIMRIPANPLPQGILEAQANDKNTLRSVFGTQGLSATAEDKDRTARGMILNANQDTSRIGGGVGDALEQVADNVFNWWLQLYYVFYDLPHYGAVMGNGRAVEFVTIVNANLDRHFVVDVVPNSMKPRDETSEYNMAVDLVNKGWLDPISFFKRINDSNPMETAKMVAMWRTNPQLYMATFFPEAQPVAIPGASPPGIVNPGDVGAIQAGAEDTLIQGVPSSVLSEVPLNGQQIAA